MNFWNFADCSFSSASLVAQSRLFTFIRSMYQISLYDIWKVPWLNIFKQAAVVCDAFWLSASKKKHFVQPNAVFYDVSLCPLGWRWRRHCDNTLGTTVEQLSNGHFVSCGFTLSYDYLNGPERLGRLTLLMSYPFFFFFFFAFHFQVVNEVAFRHLNEELNNFFLRKSNRSAFHRLFIYR